MVRLFRQQFMILVEEVRRLGPQPVVLVYHYRWNIDPEIGSYFVKMVESLGAKFGIDDHCTGSRYFWIELFVTETLGLKKVA